MRAHVVRVGPQGRAIELFTSEPQAMVAVADEVEVLTLDNLAALEARKPQVSAGVIARTQGALIGWQNADEFDTEELQEHGDVLRDATRALLAAVEAAPPPERCAHCRGTGYTWSGPEPNAEQPDGLCEECGGSGQDAPDEERLTESSDADPACADVCADMTEDVEVLRRQRNGWCQDAAYFCRDADYWRDRALKAEALLAAVEAAPDEERLTVPPVKHRFAEWCGENFAAIWYEFSLLRDELGLPQPECDEEASGSDPASAPDFAAMSPDDLSLEEVQALRDWLRHEGLLEMHDLLGGQVQVTLWAHDGGTMLRRATGPTEPAALLALCQAVASSKAGA